MADDEKNDGPLPRDAPTTRALANYSNDHFAALSFLAYLWKMIVMVDYGPRNSASPDDPPTLQAPPDGAVAQMKLHTRYLSEMDFCRAVNSFQTYLAELLTMIFEAHPGMLKSDKKMVTRQFCIEHHTANDLISALAEQTVHELTYQSLDDLAEFFQKFLHLPLFTRQEDLRQVLLYVDIRNIITHNRGIVNRFFLQRHPDFPAALGTPIVFESDREVSEIAGSLLSRARELDSRAAAKFRLQTIRPE
jgi:hypothetical protein